MKKMTLKMRLLGGLVIVSMLFAASCAQGVDDESFTSTVTNAQLESPAVADVSIAFVTDAAGVEQVKVSWPIVKGAGGFLCNVWNLNNPDSPIAVVDNEEVDGTSFLFPLAEDTDYSISIQTLGNDRYNNKGAESATELDLSTKIEGIAIPTTADLGEFITKYIADNAADLAAKRAADPNFELAFDLEAEGKYTMNQKADFGLQPTRLRGKEGRRAIITIGQDGGFVVAAGLKVRHANFDCTTMTQKGVFSCSNTQYPELEGSKFGYPGSCYYIEKPIIIEACNFKNVPLSFIHNGNNSWSVYSIQIRNCIVQLNNGKSDKRASFIDFYGDPGYYQGTGNKWQGFVKELTIANSTLYNLQKSNAYFLRYSNVSQTDKYYKTTFGYTRFENSIIACPTGQHFGNGVPNKDSGYFMVCTGVIFYDCKNVYKLIQSNVLKNPSSIIMNNVFNKYSSTDSDSKIGVEETDLQFASPMSELDLNDSEYGGQNFKASSAKASTIGDPRWHNK